MYWYVMYWYAVTPEHFRCKQKRDQTDFTDQGVLLHVLNKVVGFFVFVFFLKKRELYKG